MRNSPRYLWLVRTTVAVAVAICLEGAAQKPILPPKSKQTTSKSESTAKKKTVGKTRQTTEPVAAKRPAPTVYFDAGECALISGDNKYFLVSVDGGSFKMGLTREQYGMGYHPEEEPVHNVTLSSFFIGATEVPQWLWTDVMGATDFKVKGNRLPAEANWYECQEFIARLSSHTGVYFKMPTEAQWEYAARGGQSEDTKFSGSDDISEVAWYLQNSGSVPHEVGTKKPNRLGLYDMTGNAYEWCEDYFGPYEADDVVDPTGASLSPDDSIFGARVRRGGSCISNESYSRVSHRDAAAPASYKHGIRLVMASSDENPALRLSYDRENGVIRSDGHEYRLVKIGGGTFTMGGTSEQGTDADAGEKPTHKVTLSPYMIGATEVPQWLWSAVMNTNQSRWKGDNLPVEQASWDDCRLFVVRLSQLLDDDFSLPTEAQWEYAARGGKSGGYKYAGGDNVADVAWNASTSNGATHPVGQKAPNEFGLYDMSGNVSEWCLDGFGPYKVTAKTDPKGSDDWHKVVRGGNWQSEAKNCRVSARTGYSDGYGLNTLGFRIAKPAK